MFSLLLWDASAGDARFDALSFSRLITSMLLIRAGASPLLRTSMTRVFS